MMMPQTHGQHLATISYASRFWDVYLEFDDDPRRPDMARARLAFSPADGTSASDAVRTSVIIIEPTFEEAVAKAHAFEDRHLVAFLRSCLPGD
ncbi:MAG: hypothetical protein HY704_08945 [Gemmatimonadetes bacterium]|nr:hypothetical protein [Gemmatimonadota bacterium]